MGISISLHEESSWLEQRLPAEWAHPLKKQQEEVSRILQNIFNVKLITLLLTEQDSGFLWCGNNRGFREQSLVHKESEI